MALTRQEKLYKIRYKIVYKSCCSQGFRVETRQASGLSVRLARFSLDGCEAGNLHINKHFAVFWQNAH